MQLQTRLLRRALTATALAVLTASACSPGGDEDAPSAPSVLPTAVVNPGASVAEMPGPAAPTPGAAITQFVEGEATGDAEQAWSIMSAADRRRYPTPESWRSERAQLPRILSVELTGQEPQRLGDGQVEVLAPVDMEPALDAVNGLVPGRADATWVAVSEDGGWRVSYGQSSFVPRVELGSDEGVPAAAIDWARGRQRCQPAADGTFEHEVTGGVMGVAGLADRLCNAAGAISGGDPTRLSGPDAEPIIAAFGGEAVDWARVVALQGPVPMRAVLGPLGEKWIVVGVLAP